MVGSTDDAHIGVFLFQNVQKYRLFLESEQLDVLNHQCAALCLQKVALNAVIRLAAVRFRVMSADKCRSTGFQDDQRFLHSGALKIDLPCNLLLTHTTFAEDYTVGVCRCHSSDGLFNLKEGFTPAWNECVAELKHDILRLRILSDGFFKLLVNRGSLNYVDSTTIAQHVKQVRPV